MNEKARILFIDDEERILRSLKMLFRGQYTVHTTVDPEEALDIIRKEKIHVVISDQRMPAMLGVDFLRCVKEISPNTMRLLLTGYSDLSAVVNSVNEGEIFRYINKPWNSDEIKETVAKAAEIAISLEQFSQPIPKIDGVAHDALHFLLIDDDLQTQQTLCNVLGKDHHLHHASSLDHAFEVLESQPIAIVISEVRVGAEEVSGVIKLLKQYNPQMLTLVLTSFQDTKILIELINHGQVYRFLPKPIHDGLLTKSVQAAVQHYRSLKETPLLLKRYQVESTVIEPVIANTKVSSRIMSYIKKIRLLPQARQ
jgi:DNA-binding NtrC family response regulator